MGLFISLRERNTFKSIFKWGYRTTRLSGLSAIVKMGVAPLRSTILLPSIILSKTGVQCPNRVERVSHRKDVRHRVGWTM